MRGLKAKTVLITGAGRRKGLGEGIARRFVTEGANVVIADLDRPSGEQFPDHGVPAPTEMQSIVEELSALGPGQAVSVACDVRSESDVQAAVAAAVETFGGVDVLINNAGVGYLMSPIVDTDLSDWDVVLGVNLTGTFLATKHAGRQMIKQGRGGRIINISSQGGKSGFPHAGAYVSSKHAVIGFTRTAAIEFGSHDITVNAVCPNHVTTGLGSWQNEYFSRLLGQTLDEYMDGMRSRIPLGRNGLPEDIAAACAFLASDDASYISGDALNVSGGEETH
jgi:meso-butanediol dehydrogenase/(S,S)-butanediol dehydrogenase/diacetyl reductase